MTTQEKVAEYMAQIKQLPLESRQCGENSSVRYPQMECVETLLTSLLSHKYAILVQNFDCENTTAYIWNNRIFNTKHEAKQAFNANLDALLQDHWVYNALAHRENADEDIEIDYTGESYCASDHDNGRMFEVDIIELEY